MSHPLQEESQNGFKRISRKWIQKENLKPKVKITRNGQIRKGFAKRLHRRRFSELATKFRAVGEIEKHHEDAVRPEYRNFTGI